MSARHGLTLGSMIATASPCEFTLGSTTVLSSHWEPAPEMCLSVTFGSVEAKFPAICRPRLRRVSSCCWSAQEERRGWHGQYGPIFYGPTPQGAYRAWERNSGDGE